MRIDDETNAILDIFTESRGVSKNHLVCDAITSMIFMHSDPNRNPNPKAIFSHTMLHFLFERCSEAEIDALAQLSYDISINEFKTVDFAKHPQAPMSFTDPLLLARGLVKFVFSPKGHGWFEEADYIVRGANITIYGKHNLGPKFHRFIRHLLKFYFQSDTIAQKYEVIRERQESRADFGDAYDYISVKPGFYTLAFTLSPMD